MRGMRGIRESGEGGRELSGTGPSRDHRRRIPRAAGCRRMRRPDEAFRLFAREHVTALVWIRPPDPYLVSFVLFSTSGSRQGGGPEIQALQAPRLAGATYASGPKAPGSPAAD
ncbi:hypothetical protein BO70DRAFT_148118 [Aspergillus heteromorphus CBS 117.55]|uniref:Uncharacterized protein n=1 Tax=Aspergillus heteromorphus CBS 117.55 TaxID=1448321 RepID=A0A317V5J6_9EURO|nr:uncharacterized protein BO70DRAFT_148118 [Aspergillus heteromorphus CBS 117.55]PWY69563.1 hypothetical protein BO70DRAFT_148118 [Aspergillus heteromorphus CBS 117.55]